MGSLLSALQNAGNSLDVFEKAMGVVQSNVSNASTAGYVTQTANLTSTAFQPGDNLYGGVELSGVSNARNESAEQAVWSQNSQLGTATQQSSSLSSLQSVFSISSTSGISSALSGLYSAFSAWSQSPSDPTVQQQVLSAASSVTQAFNTAATSVDQLESQTNTQLQSTVTQINQLSSQIAQINAQKQNGDSNDAGLDASLYNDLESLSNLTNISVQNESDGTVNVLMGGQTPLVLGTTAPPLTVSFSTPAGATNPDAPPDAHITTPDGQDVTNIATQGTLAGLVQFRNTTLPSVIGNGTTQGSLNQLAQSVADRVNTLLESGTTPSGAAGVALFSYSSGTPTAVAGSLSVSASITASGLAAASTDEANGTADALSQLADPQSPADMINGQSYTDFYAGVATDIGDQAASASTAETSQTDLLTQAQNARSQVSGVSLDDQATQLLQFQQAYEASAQMISEINQTLQSFMTAMQSA